MADPQTPQERTDQLVKALAPPGLRARNAVAIWGFLQESPVDRNYWRIWLTLDFSEYIEFPKGDLIHRELLATDQNPLGGYMVWISRDARVQHSSTQTTSLEARFLQGPITTGFPGVMNFPVLTERPANPVMPQPPSGGGCSNMPGSCL